MDKKNVAEEVREKLEIIKRISKLLSCSPEEIVERTEKLKRDVEELEKKLQDTEVVFSGEKQSLGGE